MANDGKCQENGQEDGDDTDDDEYLHVVSGGPWTIFGQYLIVRPWTPSFTTDQYFPTSLLVWIRLPGLSEGLYTGSLLKFIGRAIGPVFILTLGNCWFQNCKLTKEFNPWNKNLCLWCASSVGDSSILAMHVCIGLRKEKQLKELQWRISTRIQQLKEGLRIRAPTRIL
ncbi:hypothetical protein J1N35_041326 [Gossypium stocksii]|uniref:DUF4283 domain-containing protein n=1 Tax=Gossypium stocksii TaxID=47602 RepID=A0A9D3ZJA1_9ROSI|nr:hypothetical protein J1N35_041326 [Gossypium stocksii]